ncbi:MAG: patatin-like phospholipase family protein, partial [bacterium]|nr:patatin-like phospholipase family protein [bacterium]
LVAALYAFGKNYKQIEKIAAELDWLDVSGLSLSQYGLLSNKKLGKIINKAIGDVDFEDARIPLAMIATDISHGKEVVLKQGNVATAVMASTCIPGIFIPVEIEGKLLVDGGVVENVPVSPLKDIGANTIIGVDLNAKTVFKKPENIIGVLLNTLDITLLNATKLQTEQADILITPDLSEFNLIDADQMNDLIEIGYSEARSVLEKRV